MTEQPLAWSHDPNLTSEQNRRALRKFMGYKNVDHYLRRNMAVMVKTEFKKLMKVMGFIWRPDTVRKALRKLILQGLISKYFVINEEGEKVYYLEWTGPVYDGSLEPRR